jgi:predicted P-loop ATPase
MKQQYENNQTGSENQEFDLSIIPVSSLKQPFRPWAEYQTKIAPISEWHSHYCTQGTVGIICGRISGNLEIIDIDVKNDPNGTIMDEFVNLIPHNLYSRLLVQTTPNYGYHIIYRCPDVIIEKNQKLALHSDQAVIIEIRGEGGYFCTNKIKNKFIQGNLNLEDLNYDIPVITTDEREFLLETARSLTRYFPIRSLNSSKNENGFTYKEPAINEFNNKYHIIEVFLKHGWSVVNEDDQKYYLLRSGSSARHSGYYFKDSRTFFCFSTSTGFQPEKPYNNFQILQVMEGDNDYNKTLRLLSDYGYSVSQKKDKITHDDIASFLNDAGVRYDSFLQDLTLNGSIIEEIDYNTLYINLKKHFDREIPRSRFEEIIKSRYIIEVNPVKDFIKRNELRQPQGTFEKWLDCMTLRNKSIDKNIVLFYLKKWYVGMVAQTLDSEYPNEFFLCLISSEQGIGKTTFLRKYTVPKELQKYCAEHSLNYDDDFKVIMGQTILIIDDEMDGRTYEMEKTFKNLMSQDVLPTRRKYDRRISKIKRRCSFAGSGNNLNVIRENQNRRIIPIEIERLDFAKMNHVDYDDLFMEAYHLYKSGFRYSYQLEDKNRLRLLYDDYVQKSDADMVLDVQIMLPESETDAYQISLLDLVTTLLNLYPHFVKRLNVVTIGKLLNDRGFKSIRKGRNKTTYYEISKRSDIIKLISDESNGSIYLG